MYVLKDPDTNQYLMYGTGPFGSTSKIEQAYKANSLKSARTVQTRHAQSQISKRISYITLRMAEIVELKITEVPLPQEKSIGQERIFEKLRRDRPDLSVYVDAGTGELYVEC